MHQTLSLIAIFLATWSLAGYRQNRRAAKGMREFRAMSPQDLRALYEGGGSLKVVTPVGRVVRPLIVAACVTLVVWMVRTAIVG